MTGSSFYQDLTSVPVTVDSISLITGVVNSAVPASILAWLASLPVYSGTGPVPVSTGQWFISNGVPTQAT